MFWIITASSAELPALRICAGSFDEAIEKARKVDRRYCGGHVE